MSLLLSQQHIEPIFTSSQEFADYEDDLTVETIAQRVVQALDLGRDKKKERARVAELKTAFDNRATEMSQNFDVPVEVCKALGNNALRIKQARRVYMMNLNCFNSCGEIKDDDYKSILKKIERRCKVYFATNSLTERGLVTVGEYVTGRL